jgi:hypothetical protein
MRLQTGWRLASWLVPSMSEKLVLQGLKPLQCIFPSEAPRRSKRLTIQQHPELPNADEAALALTPSGSPPTL